MMSGLNQTTNIGLWSTVQWNDRVLSTSSGCRRHTLGSGFYFAFFSVDLILMTHDKRPYSEKNERYIWSIQRLIED